MERKRRRRRERTRENVGGNGEEHQSFPDPSGLDLFVLLCRSEVELHRLVHFPVLLAHQLQGEGTIQDLR